MSELAPSPNTPPPPQAPSVRSDRLRLLLAGLIGALLASVAFLIVLLVQARGPAEAVPPRVKSAPLGQPFGQSFDDMMRDMQQRMRNMGGGFRLQLGAGGDIDLRVHEEGDDVVVVAKVEGAIEGKFDMKVNGRFFTLSGQRRLGGGAFQGTVSFSQSITLPADVDATKMTSEFKDGVVRVRLPKKN
jgi:HSP20 family protein